MGLLVVFKRLASALDLSEEMDPALSAKYLELRERTAKLESLIEESQAAVEEREVLISRLQSIVPAGEQTNSYWSALFAAKGAEDPRSEGTEPAPAAGEQEEVRQLEVSASAAPSDV